jgi:Domain of unknown function (DUF4263)
MHRGTWEYAVQQLQKELKTATSKQIALGKSVGLVIDASTPHDVAAAMLRAALAEDLELTDTWPLSDRRKARLEDLRKLTNLKIDPKSDNEAAAWVAYLWLIRRQQLLGKLKPASGDIVLAHEGFKAEVSSVNADGRVLLKGGNGFGIWPDLIKSIVVRKGDTSQEAVRARIEAVNTAARRKRKADWSAALCAELAEFRIDASPTEEDVDDLERVIATAQDEKPIQQYLQEHPELLTTLLGGKERYCMRLPHLGKEYVPDFIIGDVGSVGFRWVLIELETPRSGIYLSKGDELDRFARKGKNQIMNWRNWIATQIAYARGRKSENGLRLFDIREKSEAIVFVGRRSKLPDSKEAERHELRQSNAIATQTYDWLLEHTRGAIRHGGPPSLNPYLIPNFDDDDMDDG